MTDPLYGVWVKLNENRSTFGGGGEGRGGADGRQKMYLPLVRYRYCLFCVA